MSDETVLKVEVNSRQLDRSSIPGATLIAVGLVVLVANLLHVHLVAYIWPGFFIGAGLMMLWPAYQSTVANKHSLSFLAIPGATVLVAGVMFLLMSLTHHFESMAYLWPLYLAGGAAGYGYMNRYDQDAQNSEKTYRFIRNMLVIFMVLAVFFEVVIFQSLGSWWPLLLVGLGITILVKNKRSLSNE